MDEPQSEELICSIRPHLAAQAVLARPPPRLVLVPEAAAIDAQQGGAGRGEQQLASRPALQPRPRPSAQPERPAGRQPRRVNARVRGGLAYPGVRGRSLPLAAAGHPHHAADTFGPSSLAEGGLPQPAPPAPRWVKPRQPHPRTATGRRHPRPGLLEPEPVSSFAFQPGRVGCRRLRSITEAPSGGSEST